MNHMDQQAQMQLEASNAAQDQWRYMDCDYASSGSAVMALGGTTGHVWTSIAMCQDKDVAQHLAMVLNAREAVK